MIYFNASAKVYKPIFLATYPFSKFAGTTMCVTLSYNGSAIKAQFFDKGLDKIVTESEYVFAPHSALIIGEDPTYSEEVDGHKIGLLSYPLPNETFSDIQFYIVGSPASSVEVYKVKYGLNTPILTSIYYNVYAFNWIDNGNSYSASAYTTCSGATILGSVQLAYKETPPYLYGVVC